VLYFHKQKKRTQKDLFLNELLLDDERAEKQSLYAENLEMKRAWEILEKDLDMETELASGAYGSVWQATWGHVPVAVKMLKHAVDAELDPLAGEDFNREVSFMQRIKHPNLLTFYGAGVTTANTPFLVVELMQEGSMRTVLLSERTLPCTVRLQMAMDIARGMRHLHSLGTIHRDLKSDNCLVGDNMRVKVADFGTSRLLKGRHHENRSVEWDSTTESTATLTHGVGTPLWMAPELMQRGHHYGQTIDQYSFGIVMWELVTRHEPWKEEIVESGPHFSFALRDAVLDGKRPTVPKETETEFPEAYITLMQQCWSGSPQDRPSFVEVVRILDELVSMAHNYVYAYAT
jgi:serine/threonine protein kinase